MDAGPRQGPAGTGAGQPLHFLPLHLPPLHPTATGFACVRHVGAHLWMRAGRQLWVLGEVPQRWTEGGVQHVLRPLRQLQFDCPAALLTAAAPADQEQALRRLFRFSCECEQPMHGQKLEYVLLSPAVATPQGPKLLVAVREHSVQSVTAAS